MDTLFIGNGINRITSDYSWVDLLKDLTIIAGKQGVVEIKQKPFPLLYEEIYLRGSDLIAFRKMI